MYRCESCGHLFEDGEEKVVTEDMGEYFGRPVEQKCSVCPICESSFEEVEPCKICGSYEKNSSEEYCNECKSEIRKRFLTLINENFTDEEINLLHELYDGEEL